MATDIMDFLNNIPDEFDDYNYPLIGGMWALRKDMVLMVFNVVKYVLKGPDVTAWVWVSAPTEEMALAKAKEEGDVIAGFHLHQLIAQVEEKKFLELSKAGEQMRFMNDTQSGKK